VKEENYVSYLLGTVHGYPKKNKKFLRKSFLEANIAQENAQLSFAADDTFVDISDKQLDEQLKMCISSKKEARKLFEEWEFTKDYKYSTLFKTDDFEKVIEKIKKFTKWNKNMEEYSIVDIENNFTMPIYYETDGYIIIKHCRYFSAIEPLSGEESLIKYPIVFVLHKEEKILELRFDTLRHIYIPEENAQSYYSGIIKGIMEYYKKNLIILHPLNLDFLKNELDDSTVMGKYIMLPNGGNAQLDVGKNENYILPLIGELKEILTNHIIDLSKVPALNEDLKQFMFENEELSDCGWVEIMWEDEIKTRNIRVKFIYNYQNTTCCVLQHYYNNILVGMERMNYVVKYINKHIKADTSPSHS